MVIDAMAMLVMFAGAVLGYVIGTFANPLIMAYKGQIGLLKQNNKDIIIKNNNLQAQVTKMRKFIEEVPYGDDDEGDPEEFDLNNILNVDISQPDNMLQAAAFGFVDKMKDEDIQKLIDNAGYKDMVDLQTARNFMKGMVKTKLK